MQHNPRYYYQSQSSMDSIWNNNNWIYTWNPYYYSHNNNAWNHDQNPYYENIRLTDFGNRPFVLNINQATKQNNTYRTAIWTGKKLTSNFNEY